MYEKLQPKLTMFSTVPQVFSYLVSGNLDAAFVNESIVTKQGDKIGGWMEMDKGYEPLFLVAGVVKGHENDPDVKAFLDFLASPEAKAICVKNNLRP